MEKICYGLAAASVIIVAACVSGLPAATCTALGETYGRSISSFGFTAIMAVLVALLMGWIESQAIADALQRIFLMSSKMVSRYLVTMTCLVFFLAITSSSRNLILSTRHCFFMTDASATSGSHERIKLVDLFDLKTLLFGPNVYWNE